MGKEKRKYGAILFDAGIRYILSRLFARPLKIVLVSEYPKSGGTWLSQMLAEYLEIPFPRNQLPPFSRCLLHEHFLYSPLFYKPIVLFRDGRDVMVSAYYHYLFDNSRNYSPRVEMHKQRFARHCADHGLKCELNDVKNTLPGFIHYMFKGQTSNFIKMNWASFVDSWQATNAIKTRYEDLLDDTFTEMSRIILLLLGDSHKLNSAKLRESIDTYARKNVQGRGDSFVRKGIAGDWKNHFSFDAEKMFNAFADKQLEALGYSS
jgi:hypothetical protein